MIELVSNKGFIHRGTLEDTDYFKRTYIQLQDKDSDRIEWDIIKTSIQNASLYFGSFSDWLKLQENGLYLYGARYAFLKDTLNFINGKPRSLTINNWPDLLENMPQKENKWGKTIDDIYSILPNNISTVEVLARWCMQSSGFLDLIYTLDIFVSDGVSEDIVVFN